MKIRGLVGKNGGIFLFLFKKLFDFGCSGGRGK